MTTALARSRQRSGCTDLSVLTSGHDVADARLHRAVGSAVRQGLAVEVLGLGAVSDGPAGASVHTWQRSPGLVRRFGRALVLPWRATGRVLLVIDPELVVPALVRARLGGRRLVVDVHEDYVKLLRDRAWAGSGLGRLVRVGAGLVVRLVGRADLVVVADDHVPPLRVPAGPDGERRLVVPNLPTPDYLPAPSARSAEPRAVYVGDVRASRGLHAMLEAVERAPAWRLDVVGPVAARDAQRLEAWRAGSPAVDRVRWHGRRPPRAAWGPVADAWAGLCLLADTPAFRDALPSKVYEYLCAGLPVIVTPRPRMVDLVERSGAGVVVADAVEAAAVLNRWAADPAEADRCRAAARRFATTLGDGSRHYTGLAERLAALGGHRPDPSPRKDLNP